MYVRSARARAYTSMYYAHIRKQNMEPIVYVCSRVSRSVIIDRRNYTFEIDM